MPFARSMSLALQAYAWLKLCEFAAFGSKEHLIFIQAGVQTSAPNQVCTNRHAVERKCMQLKGSVCSWKVVCLVPLPETGADYKRQYTLSCGKLSTYYAQVTLLYPGAHLHPKQGASRLSKTRQGLPTQAPSQWRTVWRPLLHCWQVLNLSVFLCALPH